jgi:hypothetical protein
MVKAKVWVVAAAMVLVAFGAMASNFRVADQVYVPIAGHVQGGSSLFVSDIFISNLVNEAVQVSVIYGPQNGKGNFTKFANRINLAANERKEIIDFFPTILPEVSTPFGVLVFSACKNGGNCDPKTCGGDGTECADFRPISVESRIYAVPCLGGTGCPTSTPATAASNGQDMPGIPWYNYVSSSEDTAGLSQVFITGFRSNAGYRSNLGVVNASQYSSTQVTATLRDGATGNSLGQKTFSLAPLSFEQPNIATIFPSVGSGTNLYVELQQGASTPTADAAANGCGDDGCPAYLAFGSVLDNQTSDPTTLESQYKQALTNAQIGCIYTPAIAGCTFKTGDKILRRAASH